MIDKTAFNLIKAKVQNALALGINEELDPVEASTQIHMRLIEVYRILKHCEETCMNEGE